MLLKVPRSPICAHMDVPNDFIDTLLKLYISNKVNMLFIYHITYSSDNQQMYDDWFEFGHVTCRSTRTVTVVTLGRNVLTFKSREWRDQYFKPIPYIFRVPAK